MEKQKKFNIAVAFILGIGFILGIVVFIKIDNLNFKIRLLEQSNDTLRSMININDEYTRDRENKLLNTILGEFENYRK